MQPTCREIAEVVAVFYDIPVRDVLGPSRIHHIARARQVAVYLCRELTDRSYPVMRQVFQRDHSTLIHSVNLIRHLIGYDEGMCRDVAALKAYFTDNTAPQAQEVGQMMLENRKAARRIEEERRERAEKLRRAKEAREAKQKVEVAAALPRLKEFFERKEIEKAAREMSDDDFFSFLLSRGLTNERRAA